jgi:adenine/guanine phosphoribosyltransferase-like PRPP-binding protein
MTEDVKAAIRAFLTEVAAKIHCARRAGAVDATAIATHLNNSGVTTRRGRTWTAASVAKFLASPGAERAFAALRQAADTSPDMRKPSITN